MAEDASPGSGATIAFGPFRLFPTQQLVLDGDHQLALGSRAYDILMALVARAGEVVSKAELIASTWPNTFVEESNLRVHVAELRRALRDGEDGNRYVATIPGRGYRFVAPIISSQGAPAAAPAPSTPFGNLPPPLTRLIGRSQLVDTLSVQLLQRRFLTLVGPGGIGKTTVAMAIAHAAAAAFRDGAVFVDLAPVGDPRLVPSTLAAALGQAIQADDPLPGLIAVLKDKHVLLVLDSCEHVIEIAAEVAERVIASALGVHVLATSREPLRAAGERTHRLAPLETPAASEGLSAAEALRFPGV